MALAMSWVAGGQERQPLPTTPAVSPIERFLERNDPPLRTYRGRRRLEARNARFKAEGWMEVTTELGPSQGLSWTVTGEGGSGYIRNRVLRKALEAEVAAVRAGESGEGRHHRAQLHLRPVGLRRRWDGHRPHRASAP